MTGITDIFKAPITGRTVLIWMVMFFGVIITVNGAFVFFALNSWPGLTTGRAYEEGLAYNETLDQAAAQDAMGWQSRVNLSPATPKGRILSVRLFSADGAGLDGLSVTALLRRPVGEGLDMDVALKQDGPGRYTALVRLPALGRWQAVLSVARGEKQSYRMVHELQASGEQ